MSISRKLCQIHGFTLVELLVALVINLLVFGALLSIFLSNLNHSATAINVNRLNQQLQAAMNLMEADIRRAGYWGTAYSGSTAQTGPSLMIGSNSNTNPFQSTAYDVQVNSTGNCILFTYDRGNAGPTTVPSTDYFGYRLSNGALQSLLPTNGSLSCTASDWETVTDPSVTISVLNFALTTTYSATGISTTGLAMRSVDITLTGYLTSNPTIIKTLTQHVRIRNDKYYAVLPS